MSTEKIQFRPLGSGVNSTPSGGTSTATPQGTASASATPSTATPIPDASAPPADTSAATPVGATVADATPANASDVTPGSLPRSVELTDEELIELANKRFGTSYKSPEDLMPKKAKTKEELAEEVAEEKRNALEWALSSGRVNLDEYNRSIAESGKNPRDIAIAVFGQKLREEDSKITDEEVEEIFRETYHEDKDEDSKLYKMGQRQIDDLAKNYLAGIQANVAGYEDDFRKFKDASSKFQQFNGQVKSRFDALQKENKLTLTYKGAEDKEETIEIPYSFDDKDIAAVRKQFQSDDMFYSFGADKGAADDKKLDAAIRHHLSARSFDKVLTQVAAAAAEKAGVNMLAYLAGKKMPQVAPTTPGATPNHTPQKETPKYSLLADFENRGRRPI
jgi:hypothetical protein